jgi:colicin import membrane protein
MIRWGCFSPHHQPMASMEDEFLDDEFVLDEAPEEPQGPTVVFAGPSDAPPALRAPAALRAPPAAARSRGWGAYIVVALGSSAVAALAAILVTRHAAPAPEAEMSVTIVQPAAATAASATAASVEATAPPPSASAPDDAAGPANEAKEEAKAALEKGRVAQAIEAGERAVALDETDAEAWLVLGASYEQKAAYTQARRCFSTCVRVATRGPRRECAALLR